MCGSALTLQLRATTHLDHLVRLRSDHAICRLLSTVICCLLTSGIRVLAYTSRAAPHVDHLVRLRILVQTLVVVMRKEIVSCAAETD